VEEARSAFALIIAGGEPVDGAVPARLGEPAWVVAADSGLDQAYRLGISPDLVIGDMDSVTAEALRRATADGTPIERHPVDKDATDLELAIAAAIRAGFSRATIIGGTGGRMAHTLANALLLIDDRSITLEWWTNGSIVTALHTGESRRYLRDDGRLLSVIPVGGRARCESTGLRWPLGSVSLRTGSTRGVSNEIVADEAIVLVAGGQVLTIQERD
jgi:thiamine pyrophosphokinase